MSDGLRIERHGPVMEITLDRPKANAIDKAMSFALGDAFVALRDDPELRVAIVTAAGDRFFSAGWDLKSAVGEDETAAEDYGPGGFAGLTELFDLDKPVIAAVNGMCVGGGFEMVLACDLIVAAEHVEFFLPEVNIGIIANAGGVLRLPKRLPRAIAADMLMTGRRLSAADALHHGLVNRVVPVPELMIASRGLADDLLAAAPLAVAAAKEVMRATEALAVDEGYKLMHGRTLPAYEKMLASEDAREGARAFAEKRPPAWRGK